MIADRTRRIALIGAVLSLALPLAGCSREDKAASEGESASEVLTQAKTNFDEASSVHLTMSTDSKPTSGDAVLGADGTLTHQPAFEGKVKVLLSGFNADVPVVAVGDKVWAKLPLTPKYSLINPAEYGAPNPADFAATDKGISGLLLNLNEVEEAGTTRDGKQVLTNYSGLLEGGFVAPIIPSADTGVAYKTIVGVDQDNQIATLEVTGEFFSGGGDETYKLAFDDYNKSVKITAP